MRKRDLKLYGIAGRVVLCSVEAPDIRHLKATRAPELHFPLGQGAEAAEQQPSATSLTSNAAPTKLP